MRQLAILTMDSLEDFYAYDTMLDEPFAAAGWQTTHVSWRDSSVDWNRFEVVIVRSTWDYQQHCDDFVACLRAIDASQATLENSLSLLLWNIEKTYLRTLADNGIPIVPTLWQDGYSPTMLDHAFAQFGGETLVVKPVLSANADDTFKIHISQAEDLQPTLQSVFSKRPLMVQPFLPAIVSPGEYSLFYFAKQYSHAILKTPKTNDFRVQEEHGGQLQSVQPTTDMLALSTKTLAALPDTPLYARVDLIETGSGLAVMEVEIIEPSLYFNMDPESPQRFVDAFCQKYAS